MSTEDRLTRIESDVNQLKSDMDRVRSDVSSMSRTLNDVATAVAEIKGGMPHMATKAEVEQASHNATRGIYASLAAVGLAIVALVTRFWPTGGVPT